MPAEDRHKKGGACIRPIDADALESAIIALIFEFEHRAPKWSSNDMLTSGIDAAKKYGYKADGAEAALNVVRRMPTIDAEPARTNRKRRTTSFERGAEMIYRLDGDKITADNNCPVEKIIAPIELTGAIMCIGYAKDFDAELKKLDVSGLRDLIDYLSGIGSWNEGVLLCEAEIARRGLHIGDVKKRFEL